MLALALLWLALPVLAWLATATAAVVAWPRRSLEPPLRRDLIVALVLGAAHAAAWAVALGAHGPRRDVVDALALVGAAIAIAGLAWAVSITLRRRAWRALAWAAAHALFLAAYATDLGRDGITQML